MRGLVVAVLASAVAYGIWMSTDARLVQMPEGADLMATSSSSVAASSTVPIAMMVDSESTPRWIDAKGNIFSNVHMSGISGGILHGRRISTGEPAYFDVARAKVMFPVREIPSPRAERRASLGAPRTDGALTLNLHHGSSTQTIVARLNDGQAIRDGRLIGWWNETTLAVIGRTSGMPTVYAVPVSAAARVITALPESAERVRMIDGVMWYVVASPGEGLESDLRPPSELRRLVIDGRETSVVRDEDEVIVEYDVTPKDDVVYKTSDDRVYRAVQAGKPSAFIGSGALLGATTEGGVLMRREGRLIIRSFDGGERVAEDLGMPDEDSFIFSIHEMTPL